MQQMRVYNFEVWGCSTTKLWHLSCF